MATHVCIHGHFYQPPRENPWTGVILPESSAAPQRDWNTRILAESYEPLAFARRLDSTGCIIEILNCYEWLSFNVGPTLVRWLALNAPHVLDKMIEGDRASMLRLGHGNALAQCYHHQIMPLATADERSIEVAWAIADFTTQFGRNPEGMWLPEAAVDVPSLETLADYNIEFVVLAPRQAKAVAAENNDRQGNDSSWTDVTEDSVDCTQAYWINLPSGRRIAAFFYNGAISRAVAFEHLLADGDTFWNKIRAVAWQTGKDHVGLLSISTDGETYGHHFKFGEMALAHAISKGRDKHDGLTIANYGYWLAKHPPQHKVLLHEPSSWSCVHGVERWRSNCGCSDGGHWGWNQEWRAPLRQALRVVKKIFDEQYHTVAKDIFKNPQQALLRYGSLLALHTKSIAMQKQASEQFIKQECLPQLSVKAIDTGWKLLTMQEVAHASFASCAWFFDEITRIEPLNAMTFALYAMDLCKATGGIDLRDTFIQELNQATSNKPEEGTGADVFKKHVLPRVSTPAHLALEGLYMLHAHGKLGVDAKTSVTWSSIHMDVEVGSYSTEKATTERTTPEEATVQGTLALRLPLQELGDEYMFVWNTGGLALQPDACTPKNMLANDSMALGCSLLGSIQLTPSNGNHKGVSSSCYGKDLSSAVRQELVNNWLKGNIENTWNSSCGFLQSLLAFLPAREVEQKSLMFESQWATVLPFVAAHVVAEPCLLETTLPYITEFMQDSALSSSQKALQIYSVEKVLDYALKMQLEKTERDWTMFAQQIGIARQLLGYSCPLWKVQNILWEKKAYIFAEQSGKECLKQAGFAE